MNERKKEIKRKKVVNQNVRWLKKELEKNYLGIYAYAMRLNLYWTGPLFLFFFLFFEKARHLFYCCNIRDNLRWHGFIMRISERIKVNENQQASLF